MDDFKALLEFPGRPDEKDWIKERLDTLSEKESIIFAAMNFARPPATATDAINHLLSLGEYEVCWPASSYHALGEFYLNYESAIPQEARPYLNLDRVGQWYDDQHPGLFVGDAYVQYPSRAISPQYDGTNLQQCKDTGWSVKIRLASAAHPEGVWLRLPDYQDMNDGKPDEVALALRALEAKKIQECTILDARCILPQTGNLMEQYTSPADLIYDGNALGVMLDERGQGLKRFDEIVTAALEYEGCHTLAFALDVIYNIGCYDYFPSEELQRFAERRLLGKGSPESLIRAGCMDLEGYALDILTGEGYVTTGDGSTLIARNDRAFTYEFSTPEQAGLTMEQT